jgi:[acyl-carrier-protein] S-malonyltransferase
MKKFGSIFAGQGSQALGMGKDFYENSALAKEMFEQASDAIKVDMKSILFDDADKLGQSQFTQPAILLVSSIANRLFSTESSYSPEFALGHSLGEFSALTSVGALSLEDAIKTVHNRGRWMQEACEGKEASMMVVLGLDDAKAEAVVQVAQDDKKLVWAANYNCDGQLVLAGKKSDLEPIAPLLKEAGAKRAMLLNMSVASHCPMLESAMAPLKDILSETLSENFTTKIISNVNALGYSTKEEALNLLPEQLIKPVLYKQSVLANESAVETFIEFGHGAVLKGINKKITKVPTLNISDMNSLEVVLKEMGA